MTDICENATLHMVLRLRGGGPGGSAEMGIAAGGLINQSIVPDYNPADIWVRLLNSPSSSHHPTSHKTFVVTYGCTRLLS